MIPKIRHILPGHYFVTIYKSYISLCFDYCDMVNDQRNNESFCNKIEKVQYNAALGVTCATRETSKIKLY